MDYFLIIFKKFKKPHKQTLVITKGSLQNQQLDTIENLFRWWKELMITEGSFQNQELDNNTTSDDDPTLHVCCCASSACVCVWVWWVLNPWNNSNPCNIMLLGSNATQPWRSCLFLQPTKWGIRERERVLELFVLFTLCPSILPWECFTKLALSISSYSPLNPSPPTVLRL